MRVAVVVGAVVMVAGAVVLPAAGGGAPSGETARARAERSHTQQRSVRYEPPVQAPIVDTWRPPTHRFGAGNRGIDYRTRSGQPVRACADGIVTFAGQVGGTLHVTVGHADGVRTSYSFLGSVGARRGQQVRRGQTIGTAGERPLHLGARRGTTYIDPRTLFGDDGYTVRLIPARRDP